MEQETLLQRGLLSEQRICLSDWSRCVNRVGDQWDIGLIRTVLIHGSRDDHCSDHGHQGGGEDTSEYRR